MGFRMGIQFHIYAYSIVEKEIQTVPLCTGTKQQSVITIFTTRMAKCLLAEDFMKTSTTLSKMPRLIP